MTQCTCKCDTLRKWHQFFSSSSLTHASHSKPGETSMDPKMRSTSLLQKGAQYSSQMSMSHHKRQRRLFKCARLKKAKEVWQPNAICNLTLSCAWGASPRGHFGSTNKIGITDVRFYHIGLILIVVGFYKNTFLDGVLLYSPDSPSCATPVSGFQSCGTNLTFQEQGMFLFTLVGYIASPTLAWATRSCLKNKTRSNWQEF